MAKTSEGMAERPAGAGSAGRAPLHQDEEGAGDTSAAPSRDAEPESLTAFELMAQASMRARRWGKGVGAATLLFGLVTTFYLSAAVAETGPGDVAKSEGVTILTAMLVITGLLAITLGRGAFDLAMAFGLPEKRRRLPLTMALSALALGVAAAGLTLLTFVLQFGRIEAALVERYGITLAELHASPSYVDYARERPSLGYFEAAVAAVLGAGAAWLMSRAGRTLTSEEGLPAELGRRRGLAVVAGFGTLFVTAFAVPQLFDSVDASMSLIGLALGVVAGGIVTLLLRPAATDTAGYAIRRSEALEDSAVQDALGEIRRGSRRVWWVRAVSTAAGGAVTYGSIQLADVYYRHMPSYEQPGLFLFLGLVALGVGVALLVSQRLTPKPADDAIDFPNTGGIFDDTLETTGSLTVRQQHTLLGLLFGDTAGQQFELVDGGGAWCGAAKEESSLLARLFLGWRRPLTIAIDDLGECALRVSRPFVVLMEQAIVTAGTRRLGAITRSWSPLRSVYRVSDADGRHTFTLASGWLFQSRFRIEHEGGVEGELRRLRKPWYQRMFQSSLIPEQDRFLLTFPTGANLDQRRLLVGALFLVDAAR